MKKQSIFLVASYSVSFERAHILTTNDLLNLNAEQVEKFKDSYSPAQYEKLQQLVLTQELSGLIKSEQ